MYTVFDVETNGLAKKYDAPYKDLHNWPRILQIGWSTHYNSGKLSRRRCYIIKPLDFKISKESTAIHRISESRALRVGRRLPTVMEEFLKDVRRSERLVAHNMKFDWNVVACELHRNSIYCSEFFSCKRSCTMVAGTNVCKIQFNRDKYKWPSLQELHIKLFSKKFTGAHDAAADVKACVKCYGKMKKMGVIK